MASASARWGRSAGSTVTSERRPARTSTGALGRLPGWSTARALGRPPGCLMRLPVRGDLPLAEGAVFPLHEPPPARLERVLGRGECARLHLSHVVSRRLDDLLADLREALGELRFQVRVHPEQ